MIDPKKLDEIARKLGIGQYAKPGTEIITEPIFRDSLTLYNNVEFEPKAVYDGNDKILFTYDESLTNLKNRKYERHARPIETFGLLIADLEGKLSDEQNEISKDMSNSYGEWFSLAVERKGNELICYEDPENLVWDTTKNLYVVQGKLKYGSEKKFSIKNIKSSEGINLQNFDKDLQKYLYGREGGDLPNDLKTGYLRAQLYLPPDKTIWPAGRGYGSKYDIGSWNYINGASRGVCSVFGNFSSTGTGAKK